MTNKFCAHGQPLSGICRECSPDMLTRDEQEYLTASEEVAKARVKLATMFLLYRLKAKTDTQADMQAIVETNSYLDVALAKQEIALRRITR